MKIRAFIPVAGLAVALLLGCSGNPEAHPAAKTAMTRIANTRAANDAGVISNPTGRFDYYLLTLSWTPEYCHGHRNSPECDGSHPGFVVHGLWPQYDNGRWPSHCSNAPGLANPSTMLDIMPAPRLIAHEWATHGTCTGLSARQYFAVVRRAYRSIQIPAALAAPSRTTRHSATEIKRMFTDANPGMKPDDIAVSCHNRYLSGVEFCLSKALEPIACRRVRDCTAGSIAIPQGR